MNANATTERLVALFAHQLPYLILDRDAPNREERSLLEAVLKGRDAEAIWQQLSQVWQGDAALRRAVFKVCNQPGDHDRWDELRDTFAAALEAEAHKAQRNKLAELTKRPERGSEAESAPRRPLRQVISRARWYRSVLGVGVLLITLALVASSLLAAILLGDELQLSLLRGFAIAVLAGLPGLLYLRFLDYRAYSLWNEYTLNLHRLGMDEPQYLPRPPVTSSYFLEWRGRGGDRLEGPANLYYQKFQAYYGKHVIPDLDAGVDAKVARATGFFPIFVTTAMFAAGWTALLWRSPVYSTSRMTVKDALAFGFAGVYVFVVQMLMRRYFQSDLKPSAYIGAVVRVVTVLIVVLVVHRVWGDGQIRGEEAAAAFIIGFFPLMGIQFLQRVATVSLRTFVPSLRNPYPLSDLDGLNIWYEARLLEEGIEDMQNLSTANFVDVILHTRVPVGRLVDWVDQAVLYLHLDLPRQRGKQKPAEETSRDKLRRLGIRSATALEDAFRRNTADWAKAGRGRGELVVNPQENWALVQGLRWALNAPGPRRASGRSDGPSVTQTIVKSLRDQPNLVHVRTWKSPWETSRPPGPTAPPVLEAPQPVGNGEHVSHN
jgi:hypothetical protein